MFMIHIAAITIVIVTIALALDMCIMVVVVSMGIATKILRICVLAINVVVRRGGTTAGVTGAPAGPPEGVEATPTTTKDAYVDKD